MCCCRANHRFFQYVCLLSYFYSIGVLQQHRGIFCVMCLHLTLCQLLLSLFIIPLAVAGNASLGGLSPLIGVFMCSHEHWCVVPVPPAGCFSICLPFIIYLAAYRYGNFVAATTCVLSAMLALLRYCFFCVMFVMVVSYGVYVLSCIHNQVFGY